MAPSSATPPFAWDDVQSRLRQLFSAMSGGLEPDLRDDLVQEACVRLLRVTRRETVRDTEALLATVARRTWYDHLRRAVRTRERFEALGDTDPAAAAPTWDPQIGDPAERLLLAVQELFTTHGADECLGLLRHYLAAAGWQQLAAAQGVAYQTLRKRWSRCLALARTKLAADPDLAQWLD